MKFLSYFALTIILFSLSSKDNLSVAQEANYDLASRFSRHKIENMVYSTQVIPNWFKESDRFWYTYSTSEGQKYYLVDPVKKSKREIFDNAKLAARLTEIVKDPFDAQNLPIARLVLKGDSVFAFHVVSTAKNDEIDTLTGKPKPGIKMHGFEYDFENDILKEIDNFKFPKMYPVWASVSPDKNHAVVSMGFNLYMMSGDDYEKAKMDPYDSTITYNQITFDGKADFAYGPGTADLYATDKDAKEKNRPDIVWSPNSKNFAIIRTDNSRVKDMWVVNSLAKPRPELQTYKYHMPGEKEAPKRYLYIYNVDDSLWTLVKTDRFKDQNLEIHQVPKSPRISFDEIKHDVWLGSDEFFLLTRTSRDHKRVDLCRVEVDADSVQVLIEERFNTYIETRTPVVFNDNIIWWSERDGWAHLYRYDFNGNFLNRITNGDYHVDEMTAVDTSRNRIYYIANGVDKQINPYYSHTYSIGIDGSDLKVINAGNFDNKTYTIDNGVYSVNNYSTVDSAPKSNLTDRNGNVIMELEVADLSQLFKMGYRFPEKFNVKAADGKTNLYGVMYKPFDFDSTKSYPIIEYVYPGPHTEEVNTSWSNKMDMRDRLAQIGFIVITVGNRGGHPSRSKWYHNYGYRNLRDYGLEDKKYVIEQLAAKHNYIDKERVGIHGHSGGGFMTAAALLKYPDFFKVGVASAGNHENQIYNRWWGEQHHGVEEVISAKGDTTFNFNVSTTTEIASRLKGNLLLVTGDIDNNVHPANTYRLARALIKSNKRFDIFVMPGQRHSYGQLNEYFFWLTADYFSEHLLGNMQESVDIKEILND